MRTEPDREPAINKTKKDKVVLCIAKSSSTGFKEKVRCLLRSGCQPEDMVAILAAATEPTFTGDKITLTFSR